MKKPLTLKILLVFSLLLSVAKLSAQVHIGADVAPQPFSVLELYAQYKTDTYGGLRLPQMDSLQRNALSRTYGTQALFEGLMIYNTTTQCVEYWNSKKWVSLCLGTADINLVGDNCTYDPAVCIPASAEPCAYSPKETPPCASGQPYLIHLVAGFAYTTIQIVDEFTSTFTVTFDENNTAFPRIAVVRVTNNCTGEFKDFPFTQCAGDCPGGNAFGS